MLVQSKARKLAAKNRQEVNRKQRLLGGRAAVASRSLPLLPPTPTMYLHRKHCAIFRTIFDSRASGTITFEDLKKAMHAAGFSCRHKGGGSSWTFEDAQQSRPTITFHNIHGNNDNKLHGDEIKDIGKRLRLWYGWAYETFQERESNDEGA